MAAILTYKAGVRLVTPPTPGGARIQGTVESIARLLGTPLQITCGAEGHGPLDPHTLGVAFDVHTASLHPHDVVALYFLLVTMLGPQFYVQYEAPDDGPRDPSLVAIYTQNPGATAEHLHAQVRKGSTYP